MQDILRQIPKVDKLILKSKVALELKLESDTINLTLLKQVAQEVLQICRKEAMEQKTTPNLEHCINLVVESYTKQIQKSLKALINATGIVVHTNFGRSVFSKDLLDEITPQLISYNNLEYELEKGKRGERYAHLKGLFKALFNAEDVLVVNNNAAAVFLILNTFAKGKEVVISRGELIEIGGSFRIPKVMENAQAILKEVGTTNKTHLSDYEEAISENTAILFKAHRSNYAISGFVSEVSFENLISLAKKNNIIDYYDLGSGYAKASGLDSIFKDLEPSLEDIANLNPSLVSFSGDKLLGGAQAGIIFGKKELIDKLKKNQLLRMLRVDKFTIAMLEATLKAYLENNTQKIPTIALLKQDLKTLEQKAKMLCDGIPANFIKEIIETKSYSGGGAMPDYALKSFGVSVKSNELSEEKLEQYLRNNNIIARLENGAVILDVRALLEGDIDKIIKVFCALGGQLCKKI